MDLIKIGKYISLLLRHHPEEAGLTLDEHGWVETEKLIAAVAQSYAGFTRAALDEIVATNNKKRYSYSEDGLRIRANQGHSVQVDVELEERVPPPVLWHGTAERFAESIQAQGLVSGSRLYVHLSADTDTARTVGKRHGKPVIFRVDCERMTADGYKFYLSVNGVWLTKHVPPRYLSLIGGTEI